MQSLTDLFLFLRKLRIPVDSNALWSLLQYIKQKSWGWFSNIKINNTHSWSTGKGLNTYKGHMKSQYFPKWAVGQIPLLTNNSACLILTSPLPFHQNFLHWYMIWCRITKLCISGVLTVLLSKINVLV